jgi:FAD synthase
VHIGHQALIRTAAAEASCIPTVVTFRQNPMRTTSPGSFAGDIFGLEEKLRLLEASGAAVTVLIDFSQEFSMMDGRDFVNTLLGVHPARLIVLGEDFRCGRNPGIGATEVKRLAEAKGLETRIVPPVMDGGQPVSSSRIRAALAAGRNAEAERLLGRPLHMQT